MDIHDNYVNKDTEVNINNNNDNNHDNVNVCADLEPVNEPHHSNRIRSRPTWTKDYYM